MPEREAGLAHAGTGREDHEVRPLQAVQLLVELVVAGGHADELAVVAVARLELVEGVLQRVADADHRVGDAPLGDLEHQRLGAVEGLGDVVGLVVAHLGDVAGDADEPAQQRELVDDARRSDPRSRTPACCAWICSSAARPPMPSSRSARRSSSATVTGSAGSPCPYSDWIAS